MTPFFPSYRHLFVIVIMGFLSQSLFISAARADNYLQPDTPVNEYQYSGMISIDPVGNHTTGDVISLHGTADLPSGTTLLVETMLLNCRVGACARSEDNGFPVVINGSPGKNTWSYQLNTTGFWTVDWNGNRWVYQICVNSWNSTLGDISPPCDYMSLFNQSESVPAPENTNLNISGQSGLPPISSVSTPQTNAQEGLSAPVYAVVPVAAVAIAGLVLFRNRNK